ncbi:M48 family metallopeptidase [Actomonas aquatica]|uniref:M48 family metallopeptidase n=1 Tax=Actomonas aquatica TaxID=2866162 RepID=A0ABZ1CC94_9BACT|nr:M48 family metallopeptidase [Opitutus sp. WL0086]WRQ88209.1 M48 family metallopeptidase [Opitutus sp. WL0086]
MNSLRLLALLASAVLFLTGCTTVPETGRRQVLLVSADQEAQMGLEAFTQIKQEENVSHNAMLNDRVERVGRRIAASVGRDLPNAKWEFVVFESEELNAFALPGGKVGVYTGLLYLAETDDELAAVMGHEIAHVTSRHSGERMSHQMIAVGATALSEVAMEAKDVDSDKRNIVRAALGVGTSVGVMLPFSRLHESEADAVGLRFAAGAGYDPRAAVTFWQRMMKANEGRARPPEWLSTHPSNETRIRKLSELAPQYLPLYEEAKKRIEAAESGEAPPPLAQREIGTP